MIDSLKKKLTLSYSDIFFFFVFVLIAVVFQIVPAFNIGYGVYKWHFEQPETTQGGLEILVILLLLCLSAVLFKRKNYIIIYSLISLFYLRNHQVLEAFVLAIIYFEIIISIGRMVLVFRKETPSEVESVIEKILYFIVGLTIWAFFAILFSLFGHGNFNDLRILTGVLFIVSLFMNLRYGYSKPMILTISQSIMKLNRIEKIILSIITTIVLVELAKSNTAFDYDSIWYGLRPEKVLIGDNSFFDNLGLVDFVYYYPKLFELFCLPISNLGEFSFIYSVNILLFCFIILVIYRFSLLLGADKKQAMFTSLIISSLPVLANMSSTAKTDIFTTFLLVLGAFCLFSWIVNKQSKLIPYGLIALTLSLGGKLTSFVYIPFILLGLILVLLYKKYSGENIDYSFKKEITKKSPTLYLLLTTAILVAIGIFYRTYELTGFPIYPAFGRIWSFFGFESVYPMENKGLGETYEIVGLVAFLKRWYLLFFDPKTFGHVIMLWVGNISGYLLIIIMISIIAKKISVNKQLESVLMLLPICLIGIFFGSFFPNGGDANYYLPSLILGLILLVNIAFNITTLPKVMIYLALILFLPLQLSIMFVSHPSWSWGTSKFSIELTNQVNNTKLFKDNTFKFQGLYEIEQYLKDSNSLDRCIGFGNEQLLNLLSCRFEDIPHLASSHLGNQKLVESEKAFNDYLDWSKVRYIIMPKDKIEGFPYVQSVINNYEKDPKVVKVLSNKFYLLDLYNINK